MAWRSSPCVEASQGEAVVIKRKPHRTPIIQTEIDHDNAVLRRRNNEALFDRMTQILTHVAGGKPTKQVLMKLAQQIADKKQIKVDRIAKRIKDCLICWFCEQVPDLITVAETEIGAPEKETGFEELGSQEMTFVDDEFPWVFDADRFE
jgi:type III secretory pathway component EscV